MFLGFLFLVGVVMGQIYLWYNTHIIIWTAGNCTGNYAVLFTFSEFWVFGVGEILFFRVVISSVLPLDNLNILHQGDMD